MWIEKFGLDKKGNVPILQYTPPPTFKTKAAEEKYREGEMVKWIEGVGEYDDFGFGRVRSIPGSFYFGVQQCPLKNRNTGAIERYRARDANLLVHQVARAAKQNNTPVVILKGRGSGLSTDCSGVLIPHTWKTMPGSTCIMTSKDKDTSLGLFTTKLLPMLENCEKWVFNYEKYKEKNDEGDVTKAALTATAINIMLRCKTKDSITYNELLCRETSATDRSASAFASRGGQFAFIDEFFLHQRFNQTVNSIKSVISNVETGQLSGLILAGGVLENTVTGDMFAKLYAMWKDMEMKGWMRVFMPAWMGKFVDDNGYSDKEQYTEFWHREIERLSKQENTEDLIAFQKNNPMSESDVWQFAASTEFEPDVVDLIKHQINVISENPPKVERVKLIDYDGVLMKKNDANAPFYILEEPKNGVIYDMTMDGTATGSLVSQEEGSKACSMVISRETYAPVAIYWERPQSVEISYLNTFKMLRYYNRYNGINKLSAEAQAGVAEHLSKAMIKEGLQKYIHFKKGKPFHYVTNDLRAMMLLKANPFLRKYIKTQNFMPLLQQMISELPITKKDVLACWLMWFVLLPDDFDKPARVKESSWEEEKLVWNTLLKRYERVIIKHSAENNKHIEPTDTIYY